jgi:mycofactocin precursor peptide peptidase
VRLGTLTWPEVQEAALRLLVPLGATEQHGPHLPLETDTLIATAITHAAAAAHADVAVAPALPYGASGEHAGFPGTLSVGPAVLEEAVVELVRSADHFEDVVLCSWHGGNAQAVARAVAGLRADGHNVSTWSPSSAFVAEHAGYVETSLMLAIAPEVVAAERPRGATEPVLELMPALQRGGVGAVSANGVLGDARDATGAAGARLLARLAAELSAFLDATAGPPVRS